AGGIISPVAILAVLSLFRDKLLDHFLSARLATHQGKITKALEDRKGEIIEALETHKGKITDALETHKGKITEALETRKGEITKALEDRKGLRRGFIQAGAQNLLMTLWPISDEVTVQIMSDFYEAAHNSGNAPEALADVQCFLQDTATTEKGLA